MSQWQYKVMYLDGDWEKQELEFNYLGNEGWELVAVIADVIYYQDGYPESYSCSCAYFKRKYLTKEMVG